MLVAMIGRLKADQARASEENARLARELEAARARLADSEAGLAEVIGAPDGARNDPRARLGHAGAARRSEPLRRFSDQKQQREPMAEAQVVSVEIRGQRYPIRSALDAQYVTGLATYVDEKMRAAGESTPSGDSLRLAVLAALNIADELFRCQEAQQARPGRAGRTHRGPGAAGRCRLGDITRKRAVSLFLPCLSALFTLPSALSGMYS